MYFDFDDRYSGIEPVGSAINRRDGVAVSIVVHALLALVLFFGPQFLPQPPPPDEIIQMKPRPKPEDAPRFVFVDPKMDLPPLRQLERAELSDVDRTVRSPEKGPALENPLPMARGNSSQRTEASPDEKMRG